MEEASLLHVRSANQRDLTGETTMRDLNMMEIEQVSGGGWTEWWGNVQETVQQWMSVVVDFFRDVPAPLQGVPVPNPLTICQGGISSITVTSTAGGGSTMTVVGLSGGSVGYTYVGGGMTATCYPAGGEQG
jgi:hypothetical protein